MIIPRNFTEDWNWKGTLSSKIGGQLASLALLDTSMQLVLATFRVSLFALVQDRNFLSSLLQREVRSDKSGPEKQIVVSSAKI